MLATIKQIFSIDLRTLAFWRICLGLLLLADYYNASLYLNDFYTDEGVMPRSAFMNGSSRAYLWSIFLFLGTYWWAAFLFILAAIFAVQLTLGYRTRGATILCWYFLVSLHVRNNIVLQGGDILFHLLLFWAIFLPIGARWSIDSARNPERSQLPKTVVSMGTVAILLQVCFVYWFSIFYKWNVDWLEGRAVGYALSIDQFTTPFGHLLLEQRWLTPILTYTTLIVEAFGPALAFIPWKNAYFRMTTVVLMVGMHFFFEASLELGLFGYTSMVSWLVFIPGEFWDHLARSWGFVARGIERVFGSPVRYLLGLIPERSIDWRLPLWANIFAAYLITAVFAWNLINIYPKQLKSWLNVPIEKTMRVFRLSQTWNMFSRPLRQDGWFVIPGLLANGETVDLLTDGGPLTWEKPSLVSARYQGQRWRKYYLNLLEPSVSGAIKFYGPYACHKWNSQHIAEKQLVGLQVVYMVNKTQENFEKAPIRKWVLLNYKCDTPHD